MECQETIMHICAINNQTDIFQWIIDLCPETDLHAKNSFDETPFMTAAKSGKKLIC